MCNTELHSSSPARRFPRMSRTARQTIPVATNRLSRMECLIVEIRRQQDVHLKRIDASDAVGAHERDPCEGSAKTCAEKTSSRLSNRPVWWQLGSYAGRDSLSERCEASIIASRAGPATTHRTGDRAGEAWRVRAEDNPQGAGPWEVHRTLRSSSGPKECQVVVRGGRRAGG